MLLNAPLLGSPSRSLHPFLGDLSGYNSAVHEGWAVWLPTQTNCRKVLFPSLGCQRIGIFQVDIELQHEFDNNS